MLGQDIDAANEAGEVAYVRLGKDEAYSVIVDHFDSLDLIGLAIKVVQRTLQRYPVAGLGGVHPWAVRVVVPRPGECHVIGGEILAVMPLYALAQVESELGGIIADLPAFCQIGVGKVVGAGADQLAEDKLLLLIAPPPDWYHRRPCTEIQDQRAAARGADIVPGRSAFCRGLSHGFRRLVGSRRNRRRGTGDHNQGQDENKCDVPERRHSLPPFDCTSKRRY